LKRSFFLKIFFVFSISYFLLTGLSYFFLQSEKLKSIDDQIEHAASSLLSAGINHISFDDFTEVENLILDSLDVDPPQQIINIYDKNDAFVFQNELSKILGHIFPTTEGWATINENSHRYRILTFQIQGTDKKLQIGLILDQEQQRLYSLGKKILFFNLIILFIIGFVSYHLTNRLLSPVNELSLYLENLSRNPHLSLSFLEKFKNRYKKNDEISKLITSVLKIRNHLMESQKTQYKLLAHLAHEIKTPLTLLKNGILKGDSELSLRNIDHLHEFLQVQLEILHLNNDSSLITENHALKSTQLLTNDILDLFHKEKDRIYLEHQNEFRLFCHPTLIKQILINLIENAIKHSSSGSPIHVIFNLENLSIDNEISTYEASFKNSFGLGLPWIESICQRLGWTFNVFKNEKQNTFQVLIYWRNSTDTL